MEDGRVAMVHILVEYAGQKEREIFGRPTYPEKSLTGQSPIED